MSLRIPSLLSQKAKEGENILVALTSKSILGYTIKLVSLGFYDVLLKPIDDERLKSLLQKLDSSQKIQRIIYLHEQKEEISGELCKELCSIVGNPEGKMKEVLLKVGKVASLDVPVLFFR